MIRNPGINVRVRSVNGSTELVGRLKKLETDRIRRGLDVMSELFSILGDEEILKAVSHGALVVEKYGHEEVSDEPA